MAYSYADGNVHGKILVSGDAAVTAHNILANGRLLQLSFASNLISTVLYIAVTLLLYELLKPVNRSISLLAAFFSMAGCVIGAFAGFACAKEDQVVLKSASLLFEAAAAVPVAALTALRGLRDKGHIKPGQKVLIDGASGGVGTFAIQIAKAFGAEVTAVCSTRNLDRARSLGADHVIDYTREDFSQSGRHYDLIYAANAFRSLFAYRRALSGNGICVRSGGRATFPAILQESFLSLILSLIGRKKFYGLFAKLNKKDLLFLKDLLDAGNVVPVIDRRYSLSGVADAIRYLEEGHAQGKVVITV